jgi:glucokinase
MSVLALDFGGSHVACAVVNDGAVLVSSTVTTDARSLRELLPELTLQLRKNCHAVGISPEACKGLGIGFPAIVDSKSGEILSTLGSKFADCTGSDLQAWSKREFGLPLRIENDAKLALLGESSAGSARGFDDVVMITLGTGIGVAVMLQHRLLHSQMGQAGALGGHLVVRFDGRPCVCGAIGCAEAEASTSILPELCREWPGFAESSLAQETDLDFSKIFRLRDAGDRVAHELIDHCIAIWSALTVSLIHAYGPQLVLFGGGVSQRGDEILHPLRAYVKQHSWKTIRGAAEIQTAMLGADAALIGAETLLFEEIV